MAAKVRIEGLSRRCEYSPVFSALLFTPLCSHYMFTPPSSLFTDEAHGESPRTFEFLPMPEMPEGGVE